MSIEQKFFKAFEVPEREITAEMILNLIKIAVNKGYWFYIEKYTKNHFRAAFESGYKMTQVRETVFENCVLNLCIQLKNQIKEAVQEVLA